MHQQQQQLTTQQLGSQQLSSHQQLGQLSPNQQLAQLNPHQLLQMVCQSNHWGDPVYQILENTNPQGHTLYLCRVVIPQFPAPFPHNVFQSPTWKLSQISAKVEVTQIILRQLRLSHTYLNNMLAAHYKPQQQGVAAGPRDGWR
jgi:dsRNA-specific ribonuclease